MIVCIVGAGTAGLEGLLRAREMDAQAELRLIAPDRDFHYRPVSADSLFRPVPELRLAIDRVVQHAGATRIGDRADVVHAADQQILTRDGDLVDYDKLLLAPGARSERALRQGHLWRRGDDPGFLDQMLAELHADRIRRVAVCVPRGARWTVPAYELALVLAWSTAGMRAEVTLLTAEERPLAALGPEATQLVTGELDDAGVRVVAGVDVLDAPGERRDPPAPVQLTMRPHASDGASGTAEDFDRLISLPTAVGPHLTGVARDPAGFIEVDRTLRVCGTGQIWAAGDCLSAALEHSALAARQADAAISEIFSGEDAGSRHDGAPELTGMLLAGQRDRWLAENPAGTHEPSTRCLWWPPGRAVGAKLAEQISAWNPSVHETLPEHPGGLVIHVPVALGCSAGAGSGPGAKLSAAARVARLRDIENRQQLAVRRRGREADAELREMDARLRSFGANTGHVADELRQHGYLVAGSEPGRHV